MLQRCNLSVHLCQLRAILRREFNRDHGNRADDKARRLAYSRSSCRGNKRLDQRDGNLNGIDYTGDFRGLGECFGLNEQRRQVCDGLSYDRGGSCTGKENSLFVDGFGDNGDSEADFLRGAVVRGCVAVGFKCGARDADGGDGDSDRYGTRDKKEQQGKREDAFHGVV